ncbi:hypothetical protein [Undibacterium terreum]|uniref:Uncharacterized protein n=1 Tax=Undibacterium terreum TaxID=1224302 RepID=A0A916UPD9_9BURK|nr:hypothetical protein [Undibacterium terreum]GGC78500.1 hypothetical protein GCM10011396_27110 [Undibacterium terreum]
MAYESTDQGSDSFGMVNAVGGMGGRGFFKDGESMVKGGLKAGMNISTSAAAIAKGVGTASAATGPIGAGVAYALDTCITFYEASTDLGKARSKIARLEALVGKPGTNPKTEDILVWLINKLGRRVNYDHAETGGSHIMAAATKAKWDEGGHGNRAKAVGMGVGTAVAGAVGTVGGQLATKGTRAIRGGLKKLGLMGSKRADYAKDLYSLAKGGDTVAKEIVSIVMTAGIASPSDVQKYQERIDSAMSDALASAMSSFKE